MANGAGLISGYLNQRQMVAFKKLLEKKRVTKGQVVKELVVACLVEEGLLPQTELDYARYRQELLRREPHPNSNAAKEKMLEQDEPEPEIAATQKRVVRRRKLAR